MTYQLHIERKGHFLHAQVSGDNSVDDVIGYLRELTEVCRKADCPYLLIEERLEGPRMDMAAVFKIAGESSPRDHWHFIAVAYVDVNSEGSDLMQFAETVAVNRATPVKVFETVTQAETWLVEEC